MGLEMFVADPVSERSLKIDNCHFHKELHVHVYVGPIFAWPVVLYPHCTLISSSHNVKLWEESMTDEAIGMQ